jgi:hypothetical protein
MLVRSFVKTYQTVHAMRLQLYGILRLDAILSLQRIGQLVFVLMVFLCFLRQFWLRMQRPVFFFKYPTAPNVYGVTEKKSINSIYLE